MKKKKKTAEKKTYSPHDSVSAVKYRNTFQIKIYFTSTPKRRNLFNLDIFISCIIFAHVYLYALVHWCYVYISFTLCFICALCCLFVLKMLQKVPEQRSRLQDYCAATAFMQVLFLKGYGFETNSFSRISFQKKVSSEHSVQYTTRHPSICQMIKKPIWPKYLLWNGSSSYRISLIAVFLGRGRLDWLGSWLHPEPEQPCAV